MIDLSFSIDPGLLDSAQLHSVPVLNVVFTKPISYEARAMYA